MTGALDGIALIIGYAALLAGAWFVFVTALWGCGWLVWRGLRRRPPVSCVRVDGQ